MSSQLSANITNEAAAASALLEALKDDIGDDVQAAADLIEGETSLHEAIAAAVDRIAYIDAMTTVLKARAEAMDTRRHRLDEQKTRIKRAIVGAMEALGQQKIELSIATVYTAKGRPSVIITDDTKLPEWALIRQPPKIDRSAIAKALAGGQAVDGAVLSNASTILNIRTG